MLSLTSSLTFYLVSYLTFVLTSFLTFYIAFCLAFFLTFYLTYILTFYLALCLVYKYILTFYLTDSLKFHLAWHLAFNLAFYLIIIFYLALYLTFYLHSIWHSIWPSIWPSIWLSIWHSIWHIVRHDARILSGIRFGPIQAQRDGKPTILCSGQVSARARVRARGNFSSNPGSLTWQVGKSTSSQAIPRMKQERTIKMLGGFYNHLTSASKSLSILSGDNHAPLGCNRHSSWLHPNIPAEKQKTR